MALVKEVLRKSARVLHVPEGISFFLDLYKWESVLYCFIAPFFLAVPIQLIKLATHFQLFMSFILIVVALFITIPWVIIPYWIVKKRSQQYRNIIFWGIYYVFFVVGYIVLFKLVI